MKGHWSECEWPDKQINPNTEKVFYAIACLFAFVVYISAESIFKENEMKPYMLLIKHDIARYFMDTNLLFDDIWCL